MSDVLGRHKDIMYSSRTRQVTDNFARLQRWKTRAYEALVKVPEAESDATSSARCATSSPSCPRPPSCN